MITATTNTATNNSGLQATSFGMKASAQAFKILSSSLYEDKPKAVLRETTTNALDAHLAAGVTKPIKITLPTEMEPTLSIEDFGIGMSMEFMQKEYATYFESTKNTDNTLNGGFGLGCKSPLAITDSFTVRSRKDGKEATVVVFVDAGVPNVLPVSHIDTVEPNGTKVEIPVSSKDTTRELKYICQELFTYWDVKPDFINGPTISDFKQPLKQTTSGVHLEVGYRWRLSCDLYDIFNKVIIDCFEYKIPQNMIDKVYTSLEGTHTLDFLTTSNRVIDILPRVAIGVLELAPSRERIEDTSTNVEIIKNCLIKFVDALKTDCTVACTKFFGILDKYFPDGKDTSTEAFTYKKSLLIHLEMSKINQVELTLATELCTDLEHITRKYKGRSLEDLISLVDPSKHINGDVGLLAICGYPFIKREANHHNTKFSDFRQRSLYTSEKIHWFICDCGDITKSERVKLNKLIKLEHTLNIDGNDLTLGSNYLECTLRGKFLSEVSATFSDLVTVVKPQDILKLVDKDVFLTPSTTSSSTTVKRKTKKVEDTDCIGTYRVTGKPVALASIDMNGEGTPTGNISKQSLHRFLSDLPKDVYVSFDTTRDVAIPKWFEKNISLKQFTCVRIYLKTKATIKSSYFPSSLRTQSNVFIDSNRDYRTYLEKVVKRYEEEYSVLAREVQTLHCVSYSYSCIVSSVKQEILDHKERTASYTTNKVKRDFLKSLPYTKSFLKILSTKAVNQLVKFLVLDYGSNSTRNSLSVLFDLNVYRLPSADSTLRWYSDNFEFIHDQVESGITRFTSIKKATILALKSFVKEQTK